jgi:hypothetical protein
MPPTLLRIPGQWTTDNAVVPSTEALAAVRAIAGRSKEESREALALAFSGAGIRAAGGNPEDDPEYRLLAEIAMHKGELEPEQSRLRELFRRFDNLYYPQTITEQGGADHWPEGRKPGRVHISLNSPPVYVDIPASLLAVMPVENYLAASSEEEERAAAARCERLYFQWKEDSDFEMEVHKACIVRALYGFTFAKVWWDPIEKMPAVRVIDQPENLYVGWGDSDYRRMDWTIYCYGLSPLAAAETYGVTITPIDIGEGKYASYVMKSAPGDHSDPLNQMGGFYSDMTGDRLRSAYEQTQVEVYDYWYKRPAGKGKKPEIWNAIFVGNAMVENARHREYDNLPYVPLRNTYIPGSPYGRPELYDLEQLFAEKDERVTEAAQMMHSIVGGQMWQIVGSEAPDTVADNMIPKPNKVATPGPNAELKAIQPFVPQFASEDFLTRLDNELTTISGLNDLLIGRAPATILGSSKAITALVANYEARIRMKRDLLYRWRKDVWATVAKVWEAKDGDIKEILDGRHRLHIIAPELTPRDQLENAQKALNLVAGRLWSMDRAMDATGVEDPEEEKNLIRMEQTDPALNPVAVQTQVTLAAGMQQLGIQPGQIPGGPTPQQTENTARTLNAAPPGTQSLNQPENEGIAPEQAVPENARREGGKAVIQTMTQGGESTGRILTNTPLGAE